MGSKKLAIASGVIIEHVGDDLVVFTKQSTEAVKLTGYVAHTVVAIRDGSAVDVSSSSVNDLVELGIVESSGVSRRSLITAGAVGAGAGIAMLSMPAAAAASSNTNGSDSNGSTNQFTILFATWRLDSPNYVFEASFDPAPPADTPNPSVLTVTRPGEPDFTASLTFFGDPGSTGDWRVTASEQTPPLSGSVQGSFTLDGETYTTTFTPPPPPQ